MMMVMMMLITAIIIIIVITILTTTTIIMIMTKIGAFRGFDDLVTGLSQYARSLGQGAILRKSRATHPTPITCDMCVQWYEETAQLLP